MYDLISRAETVKSLCQIAEELNAIHDGLGDHYIIAAKYIKDNKAVFPPVKLECDDMIGRQEAIDAIKKDIMGGLNYESIIKRMPPAIPEQKAGHWEEKRKENWAQKGYTVTAAADYWFECSECGAPFIFSTKYCPSCGAKMQEVTGA